MAIATTNDVAPSDRWNRTILPRPEQLRRDWSFIPSTPSLRFRMMRLASTRRARNFPRWRMLRPVTPAARWNCLFLFCPQRTLDDIQHRILEAVRALRGRLLVVVALPEDATTPPSLAVADALAIKELAGFDFSAYRIALALVAERSPGALAYLQNDSVMGPLGDVDALVEGAPWNLTGFVASRAVENHISSFAFAIRPVTPDRLALLAPALPGDRCYDAFGDVVAMQETRLARIAARGGTVGAYWYMDDAPPEPTLAGALARRAGIVDHPPPVLDLRGDPTLGMPLELLRQGFPFVKRSLFSKFGGGPDTGALTDLLRVEGWPLPGFGAGRP